MSRRRGQKGQLPIGFYLTGGEVSATTQLEISLDIGPDVTPRAAITDKGYDPNANRAACRARGIVPIIPYRENSKNRLKFFPKMLYKGCARTEQAIGKLKPVQADRATLREDGRSLGAFVAFACSLILVTSVCTAQECRSVIYAPLTS
jgi:hypothetical protein